MSVAADSGATAGLHRRGFLTLLALAPLAPCAARLSSATELADPAAAAAAFPGSDWAAAAAGAEARPLSVGYLEGSEEIDALARLAPDLRVLTIIRRGATYSAERRSVPSHEMPAGDPALVGGAALVTVHGLYPSLLPQGDAAALWPTAVDLDIRSPMAVPAGSGEIFEAWSYRRDGATENHSARVSLLVWPDWYSDLTLNLRVVPAGADAAAPAHAYTTSFTLAADQGRPRLLKGIYLLGLAPGAWNAPADLPDDPSQVPPEQLSVLLTVEPYGVRTGRG